MSLSQLSKSQRAALARRLAQARGAAPTSAAAPSNQPSTKDQSEPGAAPLTHAQLTLYAAARAQPRNPAFLVPLVLDIDGGCDADRLERAVRSLAARHGSALMRVTDGLVPQQRTDRSLLEQVALKRESVQNLQAATAALCADPIDLDRPPYMRAALLSDGARRRLVLVWHHLVIDGWSLQQWIDDLPDAYEGTLDESALPDPLEYARWEASPAGASVLSENAAYWRARLETVEETPALPLTAFEPDQQDLDVAVSVPSEVDTTLRQLAARQGGTQATAYLAVLAAVWHVCSGAGRLVIGLAGANRNLGVGDETCSLRSEMLPLVMDVRPGMTFTDTVAHCRRVLLDAVAHEPVPLADPRVARRLPNVVAMLALTTSREEEVRLGTSRAGVLATRVQGSQVPVSLVIDDGDKGHPDWRLARAGDAAVDLRAFASSCEALVQQWGAHPDLPLARFRADGTILEDARSTVHGAGRRYDPELVPAALQRFAQETPDAPAVRTDKGDWLSYAVLNRQAVSVASELRERGVRPGDRVVVAGGRSVAHVIGVHAVWKAGACAVSLRPEDPRSRLATLAREVGAAVVVSSGDVSGLEDLSRVSPESVVGSTDQQEEVVPNGQDAAYVVFTSGTSGTPKPVIVPHSALANELRWRVESIRADRDDCVLETIPLSFDPSFWQCFGMTMVGGRVVISTKDLGSAPHELVVSAKACGATIVDVVPSLLSALTDEDLAELPARVVYCGGEALPVREASRYVRHGRGTLYNIYGPSETTIDATFHQCVPGELGSGTVPIGGAIDGARLYILDDALRPVFPGQIGELFVGGSGVSWGYLGKPRVTAATFLPDPHSDVAGARMYATGDKVRQRPDGALEFHGRNDHQVKIRGHRVELSEIDTVLSRIMRGAPIVTMLVQGRLLAVAEADRTSDAEAIRAEAALVLPPYMVPQRVAFVDKFPLTPNGKIDRVALVELTAVKPVQLDLEDPIALAVRDAFEKVLGLEDVMDDDDLYSLGGASLGAARITGIIGERLGRPLRIETVLAHPSVAALTDVLKRGRQVTTLGTTGDIPGAQWVQDLERALGHETPPVCHLVLTDTEVSQEELTGCLSALLQRHAGLVSEQTGRPGDNLVTTATFPGKNPAEILDDPSWTETPLSPGSPSLHAVLLGQEGRGRAILLRLRRVHADGTSAALLAEELTTLLAGATLPQAAPWPPRLPVPDHEALDRVKSLLPWRKDPWAPTRPPRRSFVNHGVNRNLDATLVTAVAAVCQQKRVLPTAVFLAATAAALDTVHGARDLLIGVPVAARDDEDLRRVVARLVDLVPVPVAAQAGLHEIQQELVSALRNTGLGIRATAAAVDPEADLGHRPAVCGVAVFAEIPGEVPVPRADGEVPSHWADLDLVVHVSHDSLLVSASTDLMTLDDATAFSDELIQSLRQIVRADKQEINKETDKEQSL